MLALSRSRNLCRRFSLSDTLAKLKNKAKKETGTNNNTTEEEESAVEPVPTISEILAQQRKFYLSKSSNPPPNYVDEYQSSGIIISYTDIIREERMTLMKDAKVTAAAARNGDVKASSLPKPLDSVKEEFKKLINATNQIESFSDVSSKVEKVVKKCDAMIPPIPGLYPVPTTAKLPRLFPFTSPTTARLLKIALIGPANSGKSTFVNRFIGQKISITSMKAQTTRESILGIKTDIQSNVQYLFYDTPGLAPPQIKYAPTSILRDT
jgi:50S ribosome-binding GTPase